MPNNPEITAVSALEKILQNALIAEASDIHFESGHETFRIRLRIDGELQTSASPDPKLRDAIVSRIKVLARMDIAEKRVPQDGRFQYSYSTQTVDLRVSSLPTIHGEKIVIRILNFNKARPSLMALGYEPDDCEKITYAIHRPHGLILMTGPTGSGKTSSLYSCLELINKTELNISTVEDPAEIQLSGVNQVSINDKAGLTFASTMRSLLRQDPDVIMVGEIRDLETAEIAIQASLTGHLVISTLHTNDAPSSLSRLHHMGIEAFNVAASVILVTAQRLLRRLCEKCKQFIDHEHIQPYLNELQLLDHHAFAIEDTSQLKLYKAIGCSACHHGYKGRIGVFQVLPISETMRALLMQRSNANDISIQAKLEGVRTLRQAAWLKALNGVTSPDEVIAQTSHA